MKNIIFNSIELEMTQSDWTEVETYLFNITLEPLAINYCAEVIAESDTQSAIQNLTCICNNAQLNDRKFVKEMLNSFIHILSRADDNNFIGDKMILKNARVILNRYRNSHWSKTEM